MSHIKGRKYGGVQYLKTSGIYTSKKDAEDAATTFKEWGSDAKIERSREKFRGKYQYRIYIHDIARKGSPLLRPPAGSGLQLQSSFGGGGGQTHFAGGSPKHKGKKAGKKNTKKREKKGSGNLAPFGVMPRGQKTLEEMADAILG